MKRKIAKLLLALILITAIISIGMEPQVASAKSKIVKANSIALNKKSVTLVKGKKITLKATIKPKNTTQKKLVWTSSKKNIATVSSKGVVTAKKSGNTVITVTVKGTKKKATCKVKVITKVTKVTLTGEDSVQEGETITLSANVTPSEATNKAVTFTSSDNNIATVTSKGVVEGISEGTVIITATAKDGSKKYAKKVITVKKVEIEQPTEPETQEIITVNNQQALVDALNKKGVKKIIIEGNEQDSYIIPEGKYETISLEINTDKANIVNNARFSSIDINSLGDATYEENASGNSINVASEEVKIVIGQNAISSVNISSTVKEIDVRVDGSVSQMDVNTSGKVNISGTNSDANIKLNANEEATIITSIPLTMNAAKKVELILKPGSENSDITAASSDVIPEIQGTGKVDVHVTDTGKDVQVETKEIEDEYLSTITLAGNVVESDSDTQISGRAYIIKYSEGIDLENIDTLEDVEAIDITAGKYSTSDIKEGTYVLMIKAEGYKKFIQIISINSNYGEKFENEIAELVKEYSGEPASTIEGNVVNSVNKAPLSGITVQLRKYKNCKQSELVKEVVTDWEGTFRFENVEGENYTIIAVDNRVGKGNTFVTSYTNVCVNNESSKFVKIAMSEKMPENVVRFVLTWASEAKKVIRDLDAHIITPTLEEGKVCDVNYNNKNYSYNGIDYTSLDVDDTDYEGPETITIYKPLNGKYYYYIDNYSEDGTFLNSDVKVNVYKGSTLVDTITPKSSTDNTKVWNVLEYDSETGKIKIINQGINSDYYQNKFEDSRVSESEYSSVERVEYEWENGARYDSCDNVFEIRSGYSSIAKLFEKSSKFDIFMKDETVVKDYKIAVRGEEEFEKYCSRNDIDAILYFEYNGSTVVVKIAHIIGDNYSFEFGEDCPVVYDYSEGTLSLESYDTECKTIEEAIGNKNVSLVVDDSVTYSDYIVSYKGEELFEKYGKVDSDAIIIFKDFSEDKVFNVKFKYYAPDEEDW